MAKKHERTRAPKATETPSGVPDSMIIRANVNRKQERSPDYFSVYANDLQMQTTPWDIRLIFGLITSVPIDSTGVVTVTQIGELRLSPQLAKLVTMVLTQQLRGYEEQFGEIPLPRN
jgi:hypothetical protein